MAHIAIDVRALQAPSSRSRGIGLSVRGWLRALLQMPSPHRLTLLSDPRFDPHGLPTEGPFWSTIEFESHPQIGAAWRMPDEFTARAQTTAMLRDIGADVYHCTSPFESQVVVGLTTPDVPTIATFYDAMPAIDQNSYFAGVSSNLVATYFARLHALRHARHIIAISVDSARALRRITAIDPRRISVAHLAPAEDHIPPISVPPDDDNWSSRIAAPFVLAVLGIAPWKNTRRAMDGFMRWVRADSLPHRLVIAYDVPNWQRAQIEGWMDELGARERVILTGYASAKEMRWLYWHCDMALHPAVMEGFGMPVLEALAYGKPVVTSNVSSMPEITADAGVLVDPLDPDDIARGLRVARLRVGDAAWRARALAQAGKFTWDATARHVAGIYDRVAAWAARSPGPRGSETSRGGEPDPVIAPGLLSRTRRLSTVQARHAQRPAAWRRWLTHHLDEGFLQPSVQRQSAFNTAVLGYIQALCEAGGRTPGSIGLPEPALIFDEQYRVTSPLRRHATSHVLGPVIDMMMRRQSDFNTILQALLSDPDNELALRKLITMPLVLNREHRVTSAKPVVGRLIASVRLRLTRHLTDGYIESIAQQLEAFNDAIIECALQLHATTRLRRMQDESIEDEPV